MAKERKRVTGKVYRRERHMIDAGNFLIIPKDLPFAIGTEEAFTIAYLMNYARMKEDNGETIEDENSDDVWFRCSTETMMKGTQLTVWKHKKIMKFLEDEGFIKRKMIGNPAKRHISIDFDVLERAIDDGYAKKHDIDNC